MDVGWDDISDLFRPDAAQLQQFHNVRHGVGGPGIDQGGGLTLLNQIAACKTGPFKMGFNTSDTLPEILKRELLLCFPP